MDYIGTVAATTSFIDRVCQEIAANLPYMTEHRILEAHKARNEVRHAFRLFERWRAARPHLRVAQCPYAQALVHEMIAAYLRAMGYVRFRYDEDVLASLYRLLEDQPPRYDPPNRATVPPFWAGLLFI